MRLTVKLLAPVVVLVAAVSVAFAAQDWKPVLTDTIAKLVVDVEKSRSIWVDSPLDESGEPSFYPFLPTLRDAISSSVLKLGFRTEPNSLKADYYLRTKYRIVGQDLVLIPALIDAASYSIVARDIIELTSNLLPTNWNVRTLPDLARELAAKIELRSGFGFRTNIPVVFKEFVGGKSKTDQYLSEFAVTMYGYIREEISRSNSFRVVSIADSQVDDTSHYQLQGSYQISGTLMILRLILIDIESNEEIANVSSRFARNLIPSELAVLPANQTAASQMSESLAKIDNVGETKPTRSNLTIWVNKEDLTYYDGDPLMVYLRPRVDLYARVYYVMSDGATCEIFPRGGDGKLVKNHVMPIGEIAEAPDGCDVSVTAGPNIKQEKHKALKACKQRCASSSCEITSWMKITDETLGQETIKAFSSSSPIDDSAVPNSFSNGGDSCVDNYRVIRQGLSRGLSFKDDARPSGEVRLLISQHN